MSDNSVFNRTLRKVTDLKAEHIPFKFGELSYAGKYLFRAGPVLFAFGDVKKAFDITRAGMWFLCYRLQDQLDAEDEKNLWKLWEKRETEPQALADEINNFRRFQVFAGDKRDSYILTLIGDNLMSVLTNYNPLYHTEILTWIQDNNLASNLLWADVGTEGAHFYLKLDTQDGVHIGLHIVNGETGRVAFSYTAFVRTDGGYVFDWPVHAKRRHLSLIDDAKSKLGDALAEISQLKVYDMMRSIRVSDIPDLTITKNYEKLADVIAPSMNIIQLMATLSEYENKHGYKLVVRAVLDKAMEKVTESLK